jgi:hypothetical protein
MSDKSCIGEVRTANEMFCWSPFRPSSMPDQMEKRHLRVVKWLGTTPAVGVCTFCDRLFNVPMNALKRVADAQESLRIYFEKARTLYAIGKAIRTMCTSRPSIKSARPIGPRAWMADRGTTTRFITRYKAIP